MLQKIKSNIKIAFQKIKSRESFYLGGQQALTTLFTGQPFYVNTKDISVTPSILLRGYWEPNITSLYRHHIKPGMVVADVGSHMGYYSVLAGSLVGETGYVHAFEANPVIFETLFKNVFINGMIDSSTTNNVAVYSHADKLNFNTLERATGGGSIVHFTNEYKDAFRENVTSIFVDSISLDEYFQRQPSFKLDVLKIDAEGSEPFIFKGMKKVINENPLMKIFCEFNAGLIEGCGNSPYSFLTELEGLGFKLVKINSDSSLTEESIENLLADGVADLFLSKTVVTNS